MVVVSIQLNLKKIFLDIFPTIVSLRLRRRRRRHFDCATIIMHAVFELAYVKFTGVSTYVRDTKWRQFQMGMTNR